MKQVNWKILKDYLKTKDKSLQASIKIKVEERLVENKKKALMWTESPNHKKAREIMGLNFIGEPEIVEFLEFNDSVGLEEIPFNESTLIECRETHVLHPVCPLSVWDLFFQFEDAAIGMVLSEPVESKDTWPERWCHSRGSEEWVLIRKELIPGSDCKTWEEQVELVGAHEIVPTAQQLFFSIVLRSLVGSKRPIDFLGWCMEKGTGSRVRDTVATDGPKWPRSHVFVHLNHPTFLGMENSFFVDLFAHAIPDDKKYKGLGIIPLRKPDFE